MNAFSGNVWVFGDDINTDLIMPGHALMLTPQQRVKHMFEANRPGWVDEVQPGDVLVAGRNFGTGSGRPGAQVMKDLGLSCLLAESINGLFFRNCVNHAFPALEIPGITAAFAEGDEAEVDFSAGRVRNVRTNETLQGHVWPAMLLDIFNAGGIIPLLQAEGLLEVNVAG